MLKDMIYDKEAIQTMAEGILLVCKILEPTYGPSGRSIVMENSSKTVVVTSSSSQILQDFKTEDLFLDEGVQLIRDAVLNMGERVGDGSTLMALLVKGMVEEGIKYLAAGVSSVYLRRGLKKALTEALDKIDESTEYIRATESLIKAVKASCHDYEIAKMAVETYEEVSSQGVVLVKLSNSVDHYVEYEKGMVLKQGYLSPHFCTKGKDGIKYNNPYILITDYTISNFHVILPILEQIMTTGNPIIIIAEEVVGEALAMLIQNHTQGIFKTVAIKAEGYKSRKEDLLEDLAILTGGTLIKEGRGDELEKVTLDMLGKAKEVTITKDYTTIIGGMGQEWQITNRIKEIMEIIGDEKTKPYDKEKHRERIGRLKTGVAVLYAGGRTSHEIRENKTRMDEAVKTARNILDGGMIPGGGSFLRQLSNRLDETYVENEEERYGVSLLQAACRVPLKTLCKFSGLTIHAIDSKNNDTKMFGYDVERDMITDMQESGIMDSSIVVKMALNQAVSVVYEWLDSAVLMVSTAPDREDMELLKQGVPIMR
ncbi:chaperonin GroEL [Anaerosporobacter sp.]